MRKKLRVQISFALFVLLVLTALLFWFNQSTGFAGADMQAESIALEINPNYQHWFQPVGISPSPELESLLFTLQAALGAGLMGYFLGFKQGERMGHKEQRLK